MEFLPQILLLLIFIAFNGFFVASEISLVKVRKTRIDVLAKKKNRPAKLVQSALNYPSGFISATQLGITLSSLALGWIGEPIVAQIIERYLAFLPKNLLFISTHAIAITLGFIAITFFQIVLGELIPKSIAFQAAEAIALINITPLMIFLTIFKPFIWILSNTSNLALKVFRISSTSKPIISKEEIKIILSQSAESGSLDPQEISMIQRVFRISDVQIQQLMIPNNSITALNDMMTVADAIKKANTKYVHSRLPVYQYSISNIIGYLHIVDLHKAMLQHKENETLHALGIIRDTAIVDTKTPVDEVLLIMKRTKAHLVVVQDSKHKTVGITSIEDIVQNLVGDMRER